MPEIKETIATYTLTNDIWTNLKIVFGPDVRVTVRNIGGTPVSIYKTDDVNLIVTNNYIAENDIDPIEVGGLIYEVSTDNDTQAIWAKAVTGRAILSVRIFGTVDPNEDLPAVVNTFNGYIKYINNDLQKHKERTDNPHGVNKEQVGLGNIPNKISDLINSEAKDVLATSKAVHDVNKKAEDHINDKDNPHDVTSKQLNLENVMNFGIADSEDAVNAYCNNKYMTPETTMICIRRYAELAYSTLPQQVVDGIVYPRPEGWLYTDIPADARTVERLDDLKILVNKGLQVSYAFGSRSILSNEFSGEEEIIFPYDANIGIHYVYCDIDNHKDIVSFGSTTLEPYEAYVRDPSKGDFFNIAKCMMYNQKYEPIHRVYIGKVYIGNREEDNSRYIQKVLPVPIGNVAVIPVLGIQPELGDSIIVDNPFISPTECYIQVKYNGCWGETGWNDQMGVLAYPTPSDINNKITIQFGLMGFIASSSSSGNALNVEESVLTSEGLKFRLVVTKKYR